MDEGTWSDASSWLMANPAQTATAPTWLPVRSMLDAAAALARPRRLRLNGLLEQWNERLADIDGEPLCQDWTRFRPLRVRREEDWSDWLDHLLHTSRTGVFGAIVFGREPHQCIQPEVMRELRVEHRRLDLQVDWRDGSYAHLEVKAGDTAFEKTFETSELHRKGLGNAPCTDFILILRTDQNAWSQVARRNAARGTIRAVTWHDVARALRRSLAQRGESVSWRVWAASFTGAIQQNLLGHPCVKPGNPLGSNAGTVELIDMLTETLHER
jgi:hypothetical protein